jgi:hypothetical protein
LNPLPGAAGGANIAFYVWIATQQLFNRSTTCNHFDALSRNQTNGPSRSEPPETLVQTLVLYRKRADEKTVGPWEGCDGALSIQPFEGSRDTYAVAYGF